MCSAYEAAEQRIAQLEAENASLRKGMVKTGDALVRRCDEQEKRIEELEAWKETALATMNRDTEGLIDEALQPDTAEEGDGTDG